ncbi:hypothetical protein ABZS86_34765 [Streptomyces sp. NPDC005355]|uniref:hypothetical protein n=1 Tax=Streptomyces sp. NPDC005355 TaxID=3157038 RepID=UPI00339FB248
MQSARESPHSVNPSHPYYRHLYGKVYDHLDVALACTVIFDELIIAAADALYPDSSYSGDYSKVTIPALGILADWNPVHAGQDSVGDITGDLAGDPVLSRILRKVPRQHREQVVRDVVIDLLLMREYDAPVISSRGRRAMLARLIELDVLPGMRAAGGASVVEVESQAAIDAVDDLASYVTVTGLTFKSPDVGALSGIKENRLVRNYAGEFQKVLALGGEGGRSSSLFESIERAWKSRELQGRIAGGFSATSRGLSLLGLVPVVGTFTEAAALGADAVAFAGERREQKNAWYEIGPQILRLESLAAMRRHIDQNGQ